MRRYSGRMSSPWVTHIRVAPEGERYWRIIGFRIDGENFDGELRRIAGWVRPEINDSIPY